MVTSFLSHADDTTTCAASLNDAFDIDQAVGAQQDVLGTILGVSRVVTFQPTDAFGPVSGTFARASVAYDYLTGAEVASGIPRYDTTLFNQGIMIEEGTTNLALYSSDLTNAAWVKSGSPTVTYSAPYSKVVNGAGASSIDQTGFTANGGAYSFEVVAKAVSGSPQIWMGIYDATASTFLAQSNVKTLSTSSETSFSVTIASTISGHTLEIYLQFNTASGQYYVRSCQLEQKGYSTSCMETTSTTLARAAETLTIPNAGIFTQGNWAVELVYIPTDTAIPTGGFELFSYLIDSNDRLYTNVNNTGALALNVESSGTLYSISTSASFLTLGNAYAIMIAGNGSVIRFCINGVQIGSDTAYVEPVGSLPTNMYVGSYPTGVYQANGIIDDLRISSRARTLAEHQAYVSSGLPQVVDTATTFLLPFDGSLTYYVSTSPILDDATYQLVLQARIAQNMWDGTTPGIYSLFASLFPGSVYLIITDNQNMTCNVLVIGLPSILQQNLISNGYIIPRPEGVQFIYSYPANPVFSYGMDNTVFKGYDGGYWTS
jgi:hypothetical protein